MQYQLTCFIFLSKFITLSGFRICMKELFIQRFDPLTVSYAVLSGERSFLPHLKLFLAINHNEENKIVCVQLNNQLYQFFTFNHLFQMLARVTGYILMDIATEKYLPVIRGLTARVHAQHWELISPAFIVKRKMFMFKIYTAGNILGWGSLISTLKGHLCGAMEHHLTFFIGRNTNQITSTTRTVFIHLVSFKIISTNGTMLIVPTVTDSPVRKVKHNRTSRTFWICELCYKTDQPCLRFLFVPSALQIRDVMCLI